MALQSSSAGKWRKDIKFHLSSPRCCYLVLQNDQYELKLLTRQPQRGMRQSAELLKCSKHVVQEIKVNLDETRGRTPIVFCCRPRSPWKREGRFAVCAFTCALPFKLYSLGTINDIDIKSPGVKVLTSLCINRDILDVRLLWKFIWLKLWHGSGFNFKFGKFNLSL